jgi:hypothetical protein
MPAQTQPTVAVALGLDGNPLHEQLAAVAKATIEFDTKQKIGAALTPRFWDGVGKEVQGAVDKELANITISKILVDAWLKAKQFRSYADPAVHPPGEPSIATLGKHKVRSPHRIEVSLLIAGATARTLVLELELTLALEAVHLRILDGRIRALSLGTVAISGAVKCEKKELTTFPVRDVKMDREIVLDPPIPILLPNRYPAAVIAPADALAPAVAPPSLA